MAQILGGTAPPAPAGAGHFRSGWYAGVSDIKLAHILNGVVPPAPSPRLLAGWYGGLGVFNTQLDSQVFGVDRRRRAMAAIKTLEHC